MSGKTRIIKRGRGHSYELDGEKVPGVTTIISNGYPKPWLGGWAAKEIANYVVTRLRKEGDTIVADELVDDLIERNEESEWPQKFGSARLDVVSLVNVLKGVHYGERDRAAGRGTEIHLLAERLAAGEEVHPPDEIRGHVRAYADFLNEWKPKNALLERVVVSKRYRYMGKTDMICEVDGLGTGMLDTKSGKNVYSDTALQLAGYGHAEFMLDGHELVPMPKIDWYGVVHVRADGFAVYPFDVTEEDFRTFLYAQQLAKWSADDGRSSIVKRNAIKSPKEMK